MLVLPMTVFYGYLFGLPADWVIFGSLIPIIMVPILVFVYLFWFRGDDGPVEEDLGIIVPEGQNGEVHIGTLVGNIQRTEDELVVNNPEWIDNEGNPYSDMVPINKAVPETFIDTRTKKLTRLWHLLDRGDLSVLSFTTMVRGSPMNWDPPMAPLREIGKFLASRDSGRSLGTLLATRQGVVTLIGVFL